MSVTCDVACNFHLGFADHVFTRPHVPARRSLHKSPGLSIPLAVGIKEVFAKRQHLAVPAAGECDREAAIDAADRLETTDATLRPARKSSDRKSRRLREEGAASWQPARLR